NFAVAVDVVWIETNVVERGLALRDDAHLPRWIFEPDDARFVDDDDVELGVAIDVDEADGVADGERLVDFFRAEFRVDCSADEDRRDEDRSHSRQSTTHPRP